MGWCSCLEHTADDDDLMFPIDDSGTWGPFHYCPLCREQADVYSCPNGHTLEDIYGEMEYVVHVVYRTGMTNEKQAIDKVMAGELPVGYIYTRKEVK